MPVSQCLDIFLSFTTRFITMIFSAIASSLASFGEEFCADERVSSVAGSRTEIEKLAAHKAQKLLPFRKRGEEC